MPAPVGFGFKTGHDGMKEGRRGFAKKRSLRTNCTSVFVARTCQGFTNR